MLIKRRAVHGINSSAARFYILVVYEDKILGSSFDVVDLTKLSKDFADIIIIHRMAAVSTVRHPCPKQTIEFHLRTIHTVVDPVYWCYGFFNVLTTHHEHTSQLCTITWRAFGGGQTSGIIVITSRAPKQSGQENGKLGMTGIMVTASEDARRLRVWHFCSRVQCCNEMCTSGGSSQAQ